MQKRTRLNKVKCRP